MSTLLTIEEAIRLPNPIFIDVRSEGEFMEDALPGAINVPLFNDQERAIVGTLYKNQGREIAKLKGLELVSPKLTDLYEKINQLAKEQQVVVLCWRGGMRSQSVVNFLELMGIGVYRLQGGYKAYRNFVNCYLDNPLPQKELAVLRGLTGVGKTGIIAALQNLGVGAIDLEGLANHRGSAFGAVGLAEQPSQKLFETRLVKAIMENNLHHYIVVECESKRIGRVQLPNKVHEAMVLGPQILVYDSLANRVKRIIEIYTDGFQDNLVGLKESVGKLVKRLGKAKIAYLSELIDNRELEEVVSTLLVEYYDPLYNYPGEPSPNYDLCVDAKDELVAAREIKAYLAALSDS